MKSNRSQQPVLGVMVTSRTVEAVLLQPTDEAPVILRRFTRQRGDELGTKMGAAASHHPDLAEDTTVDDDFTIQFGGSQPGGTRSEERRVGTGARSPSGI